ncbi:MAG: tetratricopeptide repeat protein [Candidatus Omnitrophota bacterium]
MTKNTQNMIAAGLFALICAALYFNSLRNGFVFDDVYSLKDNCYIKDLRYIPEFFKGHFSSFPSPKGTFRPLLMLTFSLNYLFSGLAPLGYHIGNLLLHFFNGILLYSLLKLIFKKAPFGLNLIITSFFLVHPINVEAVSYITSRSDLLVTSFLLLGVLAYLKNRKVLTCLFYALALLTKETAICFGIMIVLCDLVYGAGEGKSGGAAKPRIREKVIFYACLAALTFAYLFYRKAIFGGVGNLYPPRSLYSNALTQSMVTLYYLRLFLFPAPLSVYHNLPVLRSIFQPLALVSVLAMGTIIVLIFALRKKQPIVSFGLGLFLAGLAPKFYGTLNVIASEHHFYPASIGIYLILAVLTCRIYLAHRRYFIYAASGIIMIYAILAWFRNFEWKDGITLWKAEARRDEASALVHNNLGAEYLKVGLYPEAEEELQKAIALPGIADIKIGARMSLAGIRRKQGKYSEALEELEKVRILNVRYAGVYNEIGLVYENMGKFDEAEKVLKEGLKLYPRSAHFATNIGFVAMAKGKLSEAKDYFQNAIKYDPDFSLAYYGLGQVLEGEGKTGEAIAAYEKSVRLDTAYARARYALGTLYASRGEGTEAFKELLEAVRLEPDFAAAYNNLAVLCASMDPPRLEQARSYAKKAMLLGYKVEDGLLRAIGLK